MKRKTAKEEISNSSGLSSREWKILGVVILAPFMTQIDATIVNISLSAIKDDLHSSISLVQWIISGYLLSLALVLPLNGWLVDRFGYKTVASSGAFIRLIGTLPFVWMSLYGFSSLLTIISLALRGLGSAALGIPTIATAYASVPEDKLNYAATSVNIVQRIGGPTLTTIIAIAVSQLAVNQTKLAIHSFATPFVVLIFFQVLISITTLGLPQRFEN